VADIPVAEVVAELQDLLSDLVEVRQ
jgi:hypothetical protein